MALNFQTLSIDDKTLVLTQHMDPDMITQHLNPPFKTVFFKPKSKIAISLMCIILCYKNDEELDEALLGFLAHLHPVIKKDLNGIYVLS